MLRLLSLQDNFLCSPLARELVVDHFGKPHSCNHDSPVSVTQRRAREAREAQIMVQASVSEAKQQSSLRAKQGWGRWEKDMKQSGLSILLSEMTKSCRICFGKESEKEEEKIN